MLTEVNVEAAVVAAVVEPQVTAGEVSFITRPPPNQWEVLQSRLEFQACFLHPISRKIKNLIFRRQGVCDPNVQNASLIFRGSCVMNNVSAQTSSDDTHFLHNAKENVGMYERLNTNWIFFPQSVPDSSLALPSP